ncbi:MAG: hydrogenase nickel incorporation protein HypB [Anaerolineae bacterium]|nr:hydrogenase nickel incorporation protein HypB [Anaerolineae bacterium]
MIEVGRSVIASSASVAASNRALLDETDTLALNIMASPGAGKTTLIVETARALADEFACAVVEGDVAGDLDAILVEEAGFPAVQINTGGGCHLRPDMLTAALRELDLSRTDIVFVENVGNLVCPAGVDLGEHLRVVVSSTPEGDDKPLKYPAVFRGADVVVVSKWDVALYVGFDLGRFQEGLRRLNGRAPVLCLSARTGEGMSPWLDWLREQAARERRD